MSAKLFIETLACALVDQPEDVKVGQYKDGRENVIEITVAQDDVGKIIGKRGAHAKALRTLLNAVYSEGDDVYAIEIID